MSSPVFLTDLEPLFEALHRDGRRIIGPTVVDGVVTLRELDTADRLPYGWTADVEAGSYRLHPAGHRRAFAHTAGPWSWKTYLHPPREPLWHAERAGGTVTFTDDDPTPPRLALFGVRACDVRAIRVLDRVLGVGSRYRARRAAMLIVAVNCTEPGAACFCASPDVNDTGTTNGTATTNGTVPAADTTGLAAGDRGADPRDPAFDIVLTERRDGSCVAAPGSAAGAALLDRVGAPPAEPAVVEACAAEVSAAATRMVRALPDVDLRAMLAARREHPHWDEVAGKCLTCGNCTMVCPTCFCSTVTDVTDLAGDHAERWQRWDSCFDVDFSFLHGGAVRTSAAGRYRHWLSHKFGTWYDQFGESGCVGCGRCVVWCPVGIDVTAELRALAASEPPPAETAPPAEAVPAPAGAPTVGAP